MGIQELGHLEEVPIRKVWEHEAQDFTPWLAEHLDLLGNAIGLDLERVDTEVSVGGFSLDILAEADGLGPVAIENQLSPSDHTHLGQLATYAAGVEAKALVWVAQAFRPEHLTAIDWLNQWTESEVGLFAVEVRVLQIGSSLPAPEFRAISYPKDWSRRQGSTNENTGMNADERARRVDFFHRLVQGAKQRNLATNTISWDVAKAKSFPCKVNEDGLQYWVDLRSSGRLAVELQMRTSSIERTTAIIQALEDELTKIAEELGFQPSLFPPDPEGRRGRLKGAVMMFHPWSLDDPPEEVERRVKWSLDVLEGFQTKLEPRLTNIIEGLDEEQTPGVGEAESGDVS